MNTKSVLSCAVAAAVTLSASAAMAAGHGGSGGSGGRGGPSGGGFRGGAAPARTSPGFARPGSRFGPGMSRNFRGHRGRDFDDDNFFFFGGFYDPFFYPYYGYYPYPYGYPYGYYPYGGGYGYDPYYQSGYGGVAGGVSVRQIQVRLSRAGFYHGRIDGVMGPRTRSAMRAYKQSHNRRVTQR